MRRPSPNRFPNFDTLRLMAASAVIFSHAFGITEGHERNEPFVRMLGLGQIAGLYGVYVFFIISGFLITRSFLLRKTAIEYLVRRCLRIVPGLAACALICGFVVGAAFTALPRGQYYTDPAVYDYVLQTTAFFNTSDRALPGVLFSNNDFGKIVNGSLWTLGPELLCYLLVMLLGLLGSGRAVAVAAAVPIALVMRVKGFGGSLGYLLPFFAAGSLVYFLRQLPSWVAPWLLGACVIGLGIGIAAGKPAEAFALFAGPLVIELGATTAVRLGNGARFGDISYGMYLYGWPIEEAVRRFLGDSASWWQVFVISLPVAAIAGWISWHILEKHALRSAKPLTAFFSARFARQRPVEVYS